MNSLENELLLDSSSKLPLRRYKSVINLRERLIGQYATDNGFICTIKRRNSESNLDSLQIPEDEDDFISSKSSNYQQSDDGYASCELIGDSCISFSSKKVDSSNLYELKRIRQRNYIRSKRNQIHWSPRIRARLLIERIKLHNPVSVAMQLTAIDKDLYLQINSMEIVKMILGKKFHKVSNASSNMFPSLIVCINFNCITFINQYSGH